MQKPLTITAKILAVSMLLFGTARAQQTPTTGTQQPPASKTQQTPAAKTQKPPVKKPGAAATSKAPAPLVLKTPKDKASYALGMNIGKGLHRDSVDIDPAIFLRGMKDALAGGKTALTDEEAHAALTELQNDLRKKQQEKMQALGEENKKAGDAFLTSKKAEAGVVTLPSGLEYKILTPGTGPKPTPADTVVCNYRGTFLDGSEFDSSYKRGQPATFAVNGIIKGWSEALQLMPVGSKWQLFVPPDLAYGERGAPPVIGPNATLIFEVELVSIQPPAKPEAPPAPQTPPPVKPAAPPQSATPPPMPPPAHAPSSTQPPTPPKPPSPPNNL
jgi:FKBP-type peptidyl-prolyl cis-trans isomerase